MEKTSSRNCPEGFENDSYNFYEIFPIAATKKSRGKPVSTTKVKYTVPKERLTWFEARDYCKNKKSNLATVRSLEERLQLEEIAGYKNAWIGAND